MSRPRLVDENKFEVAKCTESDSNDFNLWKELAYCSNADARRLLEYSLAKELMVLPLGLSEERGERLLSVALLDTADGDLLDRLRFATTSNIVAEQVEREVLEKAIVLAYLGNDAQVGQNVEKLIAESPEGPLALLAERVDESSMAKAWGSILARALFLSTSDIHLEPYAQRSCFSFRIDGRLEVQEDLELPSTTAQSFVRYIKVLSGIDTTGIARAGEGSFTWVLGRQIRLRVSMVPALYGDKVVIRILENELFEKCSANLFEIADQPGLSALGQIGFTHNQYRILNFYLRQERGLILTSGPTGSGKSTLLYLLVLLLQGAGRNVLSIEDPVERVIEGVTQLEVRGELCFAELLKRSLRQDPDVVMIGEIRDRLTADQTCLAASAGTLVISTLHASSAGEVFSRYSELGVDAKRLGASLNLSISQRLVRLLCPHCKTPSSVSSLGQRMFGLSSESAIFKPGGCPRCRGLGVSGRTGIFELLPMSRLLRDRLYGDSLSAQQMQSCIESLIQEGGLPGYCSIYEQARSMLLAGLISETAALESVGILDLEEN
jgi:type II secretory ATPase GspE/PulE/Tfp pilus assembly ATPase PilB-like protein